MDAAYFRMLFDYNYWARDRLLKAAAALSSEEYERPNGCTYGSIRGILLHAVWAEAVWLARWTGRPRVPEFSEAEFPTLEELARRWREEEAMMRAFLSGLTDDRLDDTVTYVSTRSGRRYTDPLWQLMAHVVNHATQHRAEAAEALTMAGHSPGDLDLLDYFREQA